MITKHKLSDFTGGWYVGDFEPSLKRTADFEASVKLHPKGEVWPKHYHKVATEYNFVFSGRVRIDGIEYVPGDIFVVHPGHVVDPEFLEDCVISCIKTPSVIGDKYEVDRSQG